jgi:hypothetical protein
LCSYYHPTPRPPFCPLRDNLTALPFIPTGRELRIYGLGSATTRIRYTAAGNTSALFNVGTAARLEVYDLTLQDDTTGIDPYYSGAINNGGYLKIAGVQFINFRTQNGGGSITTSDSLFIINSSFINGNSGGGGAIQVNLGIAQIFCTEFQNNSAYYGGALLNGAGRNTTVVGSVFNNNSGIAGGIYSLNATDIPSVVARENFWPIYPPPTPPTVNGVSNGIDTINDANRIVVNPVRSTSPLTDPATGCKPIIPITTPAITPMQELQSYYGVSINGWSGDEELNIRSAVRNIAIALAIQSGRAPIDAFNTVMRKNGLGVANLNRTTTNIGYCTTDNNTNPSTITCEFASSVVVTEQAIVHELGHVFTDRSGVGGSKNLTDYIDDPDGIIDQNNNIVMGRFQDRGDGNPGWDRGTRGWGSGPDNVISIFQQHPTGVFPNETDFTKADEAAADMFLNWVYRTLDPERTDQSIPDAFLNVSWRNNGESINTVTITYNTNNGQCYTSNGCVDPRNPGEARFEWMQGTMASIFAARTWNLP